MTERTPKPDSKRNDPWPEAAQQLARLAAQRGKQLGSAEQLQQLDAVCATISALCDTDPSHAAFENHKPLQLLGTVLAKVLDQGNHRKWRQAAYAERVRCLMEALQKVVCMGARFVSGLVAILSVATPQLLASGLLPKLAVAVQDVAVVLSAANRRPDAAATAGPSQSDQQQLGDMMLPCSMLVFLVDVLRCFPGIVLVSTVGPSLAPPAAQLAVAAISTHEQRWGVSKDALQHQQAPREGAAQQELKACLLVAQSLMNLGHEAKGEMGRQHRQQLLRAPQYHQLMLLLLAVHAQGLPQQAAGNSASTASAGSSLPVAAFAGNDSSSSSSSSRVTSSSMSNSGQQTVQQQVASSATAAGQKQPAELPYPLQLWQALGLPQQLLGVAHGVLADPYEGFHSTCSVLGLVLEELVMVNVNQFVSHDDLSPSQMAVARLHRFVPMLLLETAAAFISDTSLVMSCACAASGSVCCWRMMVDEQLAKQTDVKGHSGAAALDASTVAAQLPVRELQQLVLQLFEQLMQQPEAAGKPEPQQQQANTGASSSQRIVEQQQQQQQPGGSTDVVLALASLVRVLELLLLLLPVEFHLSWQGFSAVLQTYVRNLLSCRSNNHVEPTKQEVAIQTVAAIGHSYNCVLDLLCIQYRSQEPGQLVRAAASAAAGGAEQLQLFGLLLSTLKLWHSHILHHTGIRGEEVLPSADSVPRIHNIGLAAHHMLAGLAPTVADAASSSTAGFGEVQPAVQPAAVPWLVLQARCLYLAGAALRKQAAWKPTGGPDDLAPVGRTNADYAAHVIHGINVCVGGAADVTSRLATYLRSCRCPAPAAASTSSEHAGNAGTCTSSASTSEIRQQADVPAAQAGVLTGPSAATPAAATAAGPGTVDRDPLAAMQQDLLLLAEALLPGVASAKTAVMGLTAFGQQPGAKVLNLLQQLQQGPGRLEVLSGQLTAVGAALCAQLPRPCCCNNPGCNNMAMASEQQLVGGKSCICAGCQVARYCGKACQTEHWQQHKPVCRRIRKAAAVAGSSTS